MKLLFWILPILLLTGCSNSEKFGDTVKAIEDHCVGNISISVTTSTFGNSVTFTCNDFSELEKLK